MDNLLNIIEQNYRDSNFNINKLMRMTSYSYSYLYELFEFNTGLSPHIYIENKRMELVIILITRNNMKLVEICKACGYSNSRTFREAFKRRFNITPVKFRGKIKDGNTVQDFMDCLKN